MMADINKKISVFFYRQLNGSDHGGRFEFLLLHRVAEKGGYWQPLTGNVDAGENLKQAAYRETEEEIGYHAEDGLIHSGYEFDYSNDDRDFHEVVYGLPLPHEFEPKLCREHDDYTWAPMPEAVEKLHWDSNKKGLIAICQRLVNNDLKQSTTR
jgi:8-oxo-dGTP pyrophosphatase MutT (NUDIX family)